MTIKTRLAKLERNAQPEIEARKLEAWQRAMSEFSTSDLLAIVRDEAGGDLLARFEAATVEIPESVAARIAELVEQYGESGMIEEAQRVNYLN